ncbi:hypothetical protein N657DRAFT_668025 [Parathielavia appendiculata]|uniref:Sm domain-containing protein n=1 Tax=Parathielavia appendiculata TaxID=2587402 RepID=A0AAN6U9Z5_9PEZI|nr:hypothetical protein N657DRAFT_668025 [Parathielavia appendiculata]
MSTSNSFLNPQSEKDELLTFLRSLINKNLRITITDNRMFWGTFKCTDAQSNIILQHTYEYRQPSAQQISEAAAAATALPSPPRANPPLSGEGDGAGDVGPGEESGHGKDRNKSKVKLDMTSRYLGLVVVPGHVITRIEVEEFVSQMRGRELKVLGVREHGVAVS